MVNINQLNNSINELEGEIENIKKISDIVNKLDENKSETLNIRESLRDISRENLELLDRNRKLSLNIERDNKLLSHSIEELGDELGDKFVNTDKKIESSKSYLDTSMDEMKNELNIRLISINNDIEDTKSFLVKAREEVVDELRNRFSDTDKKIESSKLYLDSSIDEIKDELKIGLNSINKGIEDTKLLMTKINEDGLNELRDNFASMDDNIGAATSYIHKSIDEKNKQLISNIEMTEAYIIESNKNELLNIEEKFNETAEVLNRNQEDLTNSMNKQKQLILIVFIINFSLLIVILFMIKG